VDAAGKSQNVRLADVLILGPYMLFLAAKGRLSANERFMLGVIGVSTIIYNWNNYRRIAEQTAEEISRG
jgi:hypothetical protein